MDGPHRNSQHRSPRPTTLAAARAALVVGAAFAAVSLYWGLGGTAMLATVGGALAAGGRSGTLATTSLVWAAAILKMIAAVLPLTLVSSRSPARDGADPQRPGPLDGSGAVNQK